MVFNSTKAKTLDAFGPAERDLRLLSSRAAEVYKHSKFDIVLAKLHLVPIWVFLIFFLSILVQVAPGMFEMMRCYCSATSLMKKYADSNQSLVFLFSQLLPRNLIRVPVETTLVTSGGCSWRLF